MTFQSIFENYYTLYRGESTVPATTDPEFTTAMRLANAGVNRWANVDGVYWKQLWTTAQEATDGEVTTVGGTAEYDCPTNFREMGGNIKLYSGGNLIEEISLIEPQEVQLKSTSDTYAYVTGDPNNGHVLHINPAPSTSSLDIDYMYYKIPTLIEDETSVVEVPDSWFIIHYMLADRFRVSRNWGAYQTAKRDAEEALKNMQQDNISGTWSNPPTMTDNTGDTWGF